jgi:tubulin polyglutamylase TTLL9
MSKYQVERTNLCFYKIQEVVIKTLESVQKVMSAERSHSFELYGFDVLLDSKLNPWLIEVNGSPSMTANTFSDQEMKMGILDDTLSVVDL